MKLFKSLGFIWYIFLISIDLIGQAYPDRHSTSLSDGWISCNPSTNPNPLRGPNPNHWIMYNLGDLYSLQSSTIWNFNTPRRVNSWNNETWNAVTLPGRLEDGMKDVMIDISSDGISWREWGRFSLPKAPGSSFYQGVAGPDFSGKLARFVLITALNNHGGTCFGLGEFKINATIATTVASYDDGLYGASIAAVPNPFTDVSTLSMKKFPKGKASVSIFDLMGRQLFNKEMEIENELEELSITSNGFNSGLYILNVRMKESIISTKIEIIK
jgi:Secretion system C-terminal sorting domain